MSSSFYYSLIQYIFDNNDPRPSYDSIESNEESEEIVIEIVHIKYIYMYNNFLEIYFFII